MKEQSIILDQDGLVSFKTRESLLEGLGLILGIKTVYLITQENIDEQLIQELKQSIFLKIDEVKSFDAKNLNESDFGIINTENDMIRSLKFINEVIKNKDKNYLFILRNVNKYEGDLSNQLRTISEMHKIENLKILFIDDKNCDKSKYPYNDVGSKSRLYFMGYDTSQI